MSENIDYIHCPFCFSDDIHPVLAAKDHTVSEESFEIWHCGACTNRFTQHIPDAHNIAPYYQSANYVSHSDTARGIINRLYHLVRSYTLVQKRKLVVGLSGLQNGHLLDIGAGTGAFAAIMRNSGWQLTALEPDAAAREYANRKNKVNLQPAESIYQLPHDTFDVITLWHVLEHVHDLHGYFTRFHDMLKEQGRLIIAVPNYTSRDADCYGHYWAAWDVPRHLYHFSPKGMQQLASKNGFELVTIKPMWFDAFYVCMLSEQYRKGRGGLLRAFWKAAMSNLSALAKKDRCSSLIYVLRKKG